MTSIVTIPAFDFAKFYYAQVLEALVNWKRTNVPELTDESDEEPAMQFMKAFALVAHLNSVQVDMVANECSLPTAKLPSSVRNMLRLIDYEMMPATPAQVDLVYQLSRIFNASYEIIKDRAQAATKKVGTEDPVYFETLGSLTIDRTDEHSYVLAEESGVFTDHTIEANSPVTPDDDWTPWATPTTKDSIYWGHKHVQWDKLWAALTTPAANIQGVWEFYDGEWRKIAPSGVTWLGSNLELDLTSLLGYSNRQGTKIRVQLNSTTAYEEVYSTWTGTANIATTVGLLGQSTPSVDEIDYTVGSDWSILNLSSDGLSNFATTPGEIAYSVPQDILKYWKQCTIDGKAAYWLRYRIITASTPTTPVFQYTRMDTGKQYVLVSATQGRTQTDDPLGSSTGLDDQEFVTSKDNFLWGSEIIYVNSEVWNRVDNFLNSGAEDKHYMVRLGNNDRATIVFGGGNKGKNPPIGVSNISAVYRYGGGDNGNVGANTVIVDKTGLSFTEKVWNPRQASGWKEADGASEDSLARVKVEGPASLRTGSVALNTDGVVVLTKQFVNSEGVYPFSRAQAFEEGFGPKTIELVVVAKGGGLASNSQLIELQTYFNGDKYAVPPITKHLVANQEVTAVNYTQKTIDVTATVTGNVTVEQVANKLSQVIQPEALQINGVDFEWEFGETVAVARISHEIFGIDSSISNVQISAPATDVLLYPRELPIIGTISITVIEP